MAQAKKGKKQPASRGSRAATKTVKSVKITKTAQTKAAAKDVPPVQADAAAARKPRGFGSLQQWNKWLGIAYIVQALAILIAGTTRVFPIDSNFLGVDTLAGQTAGHTVYAHATRHLFDVPLAQLLALILGISAVLHLFLSGYLRNQYEEWMGKGLNPIRWLDGAFSASLLPVAIGLAVGFSDISALLMLFILGFATHLLAMLMEIYNLPYRADTPARDTKPFVLLAITGTTAWLALGLFLGASLVFGAGLPWHAWVTYLTALVFVAAITVLMIRNYRRRGRLQDYRKFEGAFMVLSFAAKSIIVWELFAAVLRP